MLIGTVLMAAALAIAPLVGVYPVFLMKALCFALFACAFNLLLGFGGLLSFGHAMFLGTAGYVCAHAAKVWGLFDLPASTYAHSQYRGSIEHATARVFGATSLANLHR